MKKNYLLLFLVCSINVNNLWSQALTKSQKLESLCKVWGFLKYYHPQVATGQFNWDEELINVLPQLEVLTTKEEVSKLYLDWISNLGKIPICKSCSESSNKEYFDKNFDLSWIDDSVFTKELSSRLRYIENNRVQGKQYYVAPTSKQVGNIMLTNEPEYPDFVWSDREMRLLIAFKYWNIIEYFFPYKYQTDISWDKVLEVAIGEMELVKSQSDFHDAFSRMVVSINDAHAGFYPPGKTFRWSPHVLKYMEGEMVVVRNRNDSLVQFSPLKKGDIIKSVDGKTVDEIINEKKPYVNGSNPASIYRNLSYQVLSSINIDEKANVLVERNNEELNVTVPRYGREHFKRGNSNNKSSYEVLTNNIGYINLDYLKIKEVPEAMKAISGTKGLIIDIRNYPKGTLYALSNHLSNNKSSFFKVTRPDYDYPGKFYIDEGSECGGLKRKWFYDNKVVLLVNEMTQSHGEFTVMALQTGDNVITIGSQTAGADGNVSRLKLAKGINTSISGIGIFYPDGTETQRKGVKIDIEVKPTIQGIVDDRDEVLERAIRVIDKQQL